METIENNKLIAEFLGVKPNERREYEMFGVIESIDQDDKHFYTARTLEFNDSWDWLMPVVEKISNTKGFYNIENDLQDLKIDSKIEDVYKSCVSFIEYINEIK